MDTELFLEQRLALSWSKHNGALIEKVVTEEGAGLQIIGGTERTTRYMCGPPLAVMPQARRLGLDCPDEPGFEANVPFMEPERHMATAGYVRGLCSMLSESGLLEPEVTLNFAVQQVRIVTSGLAEPVSDTRTYTRLTLRAVAQIGNRQVVHLDVLDPGYPPSMDAVAMSSLVAAFRERALAKVQAISIPTHLDTFVLAPGEVGILMHEIGHLFEGDQPGIDGWLGHVIGSPLVTLVDDPVWPGLPGSLTVDDEGQTCDTTVLIEQGRLVRLAHCRSTVGNRGPRTAHARRQSYQHLPLPRLSNTYLAAGRSQAADILADTRRGLYVAEIAHCRLEPRNRHVQAVISLGYLIEDGNCTQPCSGPFNFAVRDFLLAVDAVADDLQVIPGKGISGKRGQVVPVAYGQPTVRLQGLRLRQSQ